MSAPATVPTAGRDEVDPRVAATQELHTEIAQLVPLARMIDLREALPDIPKSELRQTWDPVEGQLQAWQVYDGVLQTLGQLRGSGRYERCLTLYQEASGEVLPEPTPEPTPQVVSSFDLTHVATGQQFMRHLLKLKTASGLSVRDLEKHARAVSTKNHPSKSTIDGWFRRDTVPPRSSGPLLRTLLTVLIGRQDEAAMETSRSVKAIVDDHMEVWQELLDGDRAALGTPPANTESGSHDTSDIDAARRAAVSAQSWTLALLAAFVLGVLVGALLL